MKNLLNQSDQLKSKVKSENIDSRSRLINKNLHAVEAAGSFAKIEPTLPKKSHKNRSSIWFIGAIFIILIILIILFLGILPARKAWTNFQDLIGSGQELATALKNQDLTLAKDKLPQVQQKLTRSRQAWDKIYLIRFLPVIRSYYQDGVHGFNAANSGLEAVAIAIEAIEPYADLLGLKAGSSFVAGSSDERIQVAVKTMDKLTPKLSEIGEKIEIVKSEVDQIDPARYPEKIKNQEIRARIIAAKSIIVDTSTLFLNSQPLLEALPDILGNKAEKRYLVLFQNDAELRPTGGFITAYAIFRINQGKLVVEDSEDIYRLDERIQPKKAAPPQILTFHKDVYYFHIRDSNLSPDFVTSMQQFEDLYPAEFKFDGVIAVDTHVLVEAVKILGDFVIAGRTFSAEIDTRCDCPKVIYELEDYATRPVAYIRESRKDILGMLLLQIIQKALGVSPSQYWGRLFQMGLAEINQKHILAYMKDSQAQKGIESFNMGGRIADGSPILGYQDSQEWDYLHINDANMAGAKSNLFIKHYITCDYTIEADSIVKTLNIEYKNPSPPSDCGLESGGLCLNGILRNWIRVYVPKGSVLLESKGGQSPKDGSAADFKTNQDLDKTVFEGYTEVKPLGKAQITLKYKLPMPKKSTIKLLIQKQPGTDGHEYTISVNGKQTHQFKLFTDKMVDIKL